MPQRDSHEAYTVAARQLHWIALIIAGTLAAIVVGMYVLSRHLNVDLSPPHHALPPAPRLQASPQADLAAQRAREEATLNRYGWVSREGGIAQIPIERAMALLLEDQAAPAVQEEAPPMPQNEARPLAQGRAAFRPRERPRSLPPPRDLEQRAGLDQRIGAALPTTLRFRIEPGREASLRELWGERPGILALGYFHCPNLCSTVLGGIAQSAAAMPLAAGSDYSITFLSIDPHETPQDALESRRMLAAMYPRAHVERWNLLTGDAQAIASLAGAVGFRYFYDAALGQYVHPAAIAVFTPRARIAQYRIGADYTASSLRLTLVDASRGQLGTLVDRLVLLCCGYDPTTGRYTLLISRVMQVVGIGFVLLLALVLLRLRKRTKA